MAISTYGTYAILLKKCILSLVTPTLSIKFSGAPTTVLCLLQPLQIAGSLSGISPNAATKDSKKIRPKWCLCMLDIAAEYWILIGVRQATLLHPLRRVTPCRFGGGRLLPNWRKSNDKLA